MDRSRVIARLRNHVGRKSSPETMTTCAETGAEYGPSLSLIWFKHLVVDDLAQGRLGTLFGAVLSTLAALPMMLLTDPWALCALP